MENMDIIKEVKREYFREWRKANRDKVNEYHKEWTKNNKEKVSKYQQDYWTKKALSEDC